MTFNDWNYDNTILRAANVRPSDYKRIGSLVRSSKAICRSFNRGNVDKGIRQIEELYRGYRTRH